MADLEALLNEEEELQGSISSASLEGEVSVGSTKDYNELFNQPSINDVVLIGNKTLEDLSIQEKGEYVEEAEAMSNMEILAIIESL